VSPKYQNYCDHALASFRAEQAKASHSRSNGGGTFVASDASVAWPQMDEAAYQGLAGEMVEAIEPHSESDPVAILVQFLALAGNAIGRIAYYQVEGTRHHANLFAVLVGDSSKARKGTSLGRVRAVMKVADQGWSDNRLRLAHWGAPAAEISRVMASMASKSAVRPLIYRSRCRAVSQRLQTFSVSTVDLPTTTSRNWRTVTEVRSAPLGNRADVRRICSRAAASRTAPTADLICRLNEMHRSRSSASASKPKPGVTLPS